MQDGGRKAAMENLPESILNNAVVQGRGLKVKDGQLVWCWEPQVVYGKWKNDFLAEKHGNLIPGPPGGNNPTREGSIPGVGGKGKNHICTQPID